MRTSLFLIYLYSEIQPFGVPIQSFRVYQSLLPWQNLNSDFNSVSSLNLLKALLSASTSRENTIPNAGLTSDFPSFPGSWLFLCQFICSLIPLEMGFYIEFVFSSYSELESWPQTCPLLRKDRGWRLEVWAACTKDVRKEPEQLHRSTYPFHRWGNRSGKGKRLTLRSYSQVMAELVLGFLSPECLPIFSLHQAFGGGLFFISYFLYCRHFQSCTKA